MGKGGGINTLNQVPMQASTNHAFMVLIYELKSLLSLIKTNYPITVRKEAVQ